MHLVLHGELGLARAADGQGQRRRFRRDRRILLPGRARLGRSVGPPSQPVRAVQNGQPGHRPRLGDRRVPLEPFRPVRLEADHRGLTLGEHLTREVGPRGDLLGAGLGHDVRVRHEDVACAAGPVRERGRDIVQHHHGMLGIELPDELIGRLKLDAMLDVAGRLVGGVPAQQGGMVLQRQDELPQLGELGLLPAQQVTHVQHHP